MYGLFNALLDDIEMPLRWRRRLRHQFWRPQAFHDLLNTFAKTRDVRRTSISTTIDQLENFAAEQVVADELEREGLALVGGRSIADIAARLTEKFADRSERPLSAASTALISTYLAVEGNLIEAVAQLKALQGGSNFSEAITEFEQRIVALEDQGLNPRRFMFDANFGRDLEYYTGFVFQIEASAGNHVVALAGGGRYDELLADLGALTPVPAVGCAIHTERVMAVLA